MSENDRFWPDDDLWPAVPNLSDSQRLSGMRRSWVTPFNARLARIRFRQSLVRRVNAGKPLLKRRWTQPAKMLPDCPNLTAGQNWPKREEGRCSWRTPKTLFLGRAIFVIIPFLVDILLD